MVLGSVGFGVVVLVLVLVLVVGLGSKVARLLSTVKGAVGYGDHGGVGSDALRSYGGWFAGVFAVG